LREYLVGVLSQRGRRDRLGHRRARDVKRRGDEVHRLARRIEAGYNWVNLPGRHALGPPYGGIKQSGIGREECLDELLRYTQVKSIRMALPGGGI